MPSPTGSSPSSSVADTGNVTIDALLGDAKWGGGAGTGVSIAYSFPSGTAYFDPNYPGNEWSSWGALTAAQMIQARATLQAWSNVANITFIEVSDTSTNVGDIRFATFSGGPNEAAHAYFPGGFAAAGDVWLDRNDASNTNPTPGSFGYTTLIHELGHALGLKHPFDPSPTLPTAQDNTNYTVMSYTNIDNPVTPMLYDIQAIQYLYGANLSFHTGNDNYALGGGALNQTIWDAAGTDTITMASAGTLDLRQGQLFSIGGITYAIAYNTQIENGTGSAGNDTIIGNDVANVLNGGGGVDSMRGGPGNDTYVVDHASDAITENAGEGIDAVQSSVSFVLAANLENLTLTGSANLTGTGNSLDNLLTGNSGINTLVGGLGNDVYVISNAASVVTENPGAGIDAVISPVSYALTSNVEHLTLIGSANLSGTGNALDNVITGNSGVDTLAGGEGNDTYVVNNAAVTITENLGAGTDLVLSPFTFTLPVNVENLTLIGMANVNATGNLLSNMLTGNNAANVLDGAGGSDALAGGGGRDTLMVRIGSETLEGGAGFDTAQFSGVASAYMLQRMAGGITQVTGPDGTETLHSVEKAQFTDVMLRLTPDQWLNEFNSNGDGNADLLWRHSNGTAMDWTMSGMAPNAGQTLPFLDSSWMLVENKADFNGDASSDLLWRNNNGTAMAWTMSGLQPSGGKALPFLDPSWHLLDAQGDYNGDGKNDLLWRNDGGTALVWSIAGLDVSGGKPLPFLDPSWKLITAHADFNGDGMSDLLWRNDNGLTLAWTMSGLDTSAGTVLPSMDSSWKIADAQADFNGDGKTDLLWRHTGGQAFVWTMEGLQPSGGKLLPFLDNSWALISAHADFNGDGNSDLLWRNSGGTPMAWTMSGLDTSGGAVLPQMDNSWQVIQANADFGGDGKTDLLWQHTSGQPFGWTMDGLTPIAGNLLPNPGTGWVLS